MKFEELAKEWFENKKRIIRPSSISTYYTITFNHLIPYFKDIDVITNEVVQKYVNYLAIEKKCAKRGVFEKVKILSSILKYSMRKGCKVQYMFHFDLPIALDMTRKKDIFNLNETRKLRQFLLENAESDIYAFATLFAISNGLRIGEVTGLKFGDFDFKNKTVSISRTSQRITRFDDDNNSVSTKNYVGVTKTKSSNRKLPISTDILEILSKKMIGKTADDYVFKSKYVDAPIDNHLLREHYYEFLEKLKLPKISFHGLRHTFASNCIASNLDAKTTSVLLGHADVKITLEIYTHPTFEQKKGAINKLSKLYS